MRERQQQTAGGGRHAAGPGGAATSEDRPPVEEAAVHGDEPAAPQQNGVRGPSPLGLGLLVAGCALAAAVVGGGAAVLIARAGGLEFAVSPPVGVAAAAVLLLATFAGARAARALSAARRQTRAVELVVSLVGSLPPEDPVSWQPARFRERPTLTAFLEAVGSDLLRLRARAGRQVGLDGELAQLERQLGAAELDRSVGYENPALARLAELACALQERVAAAEGRTGAVQEQNHLFSAAAAETCPLLQDALRWNSATLDRLSVHEVELKRLHEETREFGRGLTGPAAAGADPVTELQLIQQELSGAAGGDAAQDIVRAVRRLGRAAERGSRVATRAAAEAGRQGAAGESLLSLVQEVQDLVADVRAAGSLLEEATLPEGPPLEGVGRRLEQIIAIVRNQGRLSQATSRVAEGVEAVASGLQGAMQAISDLPAGFDEQAERLLQAGRTVAEAGGFEFHGLGRTEILPASETAAPPVLLDRSPSFGGAAPRPPQSDPEAGEDFVTPSRASKVPLRRPSVFDLPEEAAGPLEPSDEWRQDLQEEPERVFDLSEFDAEALDVEQDGGPASIGAIASGMPAAAADDAERVHELAEFDAVALD